MTDTVQSAPRRPAREAGKIGNAPPGFAAARQDAHRMRTDAPISSPQRRTSAAEAPAPRYAGRRP